MTEEPYAHLPSSSNDVLARLTNQDEQHVAFTLEVTKDLFSNEQQRTREIEQKAGILVGAAGVAAAVLTSIGAFLVDSRQVLEGWPLIAICVLFIALAISFSCSVVLALRVLLVGKVHYPGPSVVFDKQAASAAEYKRAHAADLFAAFSNNIDKNNHKAATLRCAQIAFGAFVAILLVTGLFTTFVSLFLD